MQGSRIPDRSLLSVPYTQLDRVLNRTSPFSIWINGENVDMLEKEGKRQNQRFDNLEDKYSEMEDGVDGIFSDSMKVDPDAHNAPHSGTKHKAFRIPFILRRGFGMMEHIVYIYISYIPLGAPRVVPYKAPIPS